MHLTSAEVALVGPGLTALVSTVAIFVNQRSTKNTLKSEAAKTRKTLEHQRVLAEDERLWAKRSETYVDLLTWIYEVTDKSKPGNVDIGPQDRINVLTARARAYGSAKIGALWSEWMELTPEGAEAAAGALMALSDAVQRELQHPKEPRDIAEDRLVEDSDRPTYGRAEPRRK